MPSVDASVNKVVAERDFDLFIEWRISFLKSASNFLKRQWKNAEKSKIIKRRHRLALAFMSAVSSGFKSRDIHTSSCVPLYNSFHTLAHQRVTRPLLQLSSWKRRLFKQTERRCKMSRVRFQWQVLELERVSQTEHVKNLVFSRDVKCMRWFVVVWHSFESSRNFTAKDHRCMHAHVINEMTHGLGYQKFYLQQFCPTF